jgi:hypothetical protein
MFFIFIFHLNFLYVFIIKILSSSFFFRAVVRLADREEYEKQRRKIIRLFRAFFYGEKMNEIEINLEQLYLENKYFKWDKYLDRGVK